MALVLVDRVRETTIVTGTSDAYLGGAVFGFQPFSVIGDGNTAYYCIAGRSAAEWEVGVGTYNAVSNVLARTEVISNSAGSEPAKLVFTSGVKDIFVTYPAERAITTDSGLYGPTGATGVVIGPTPPATDLLWADTLGNDGAYNQFYAIQFIPTTTPPADATTGCVFFDSTQNALMLNLQGSWFVLGAASLAKYIYIGPRTIPTPPTLSIPSVIAAYTPPVSISVSLTVPTPPTVSNAATTP